MDVLLVAVYVIVGLSLAWGVLRLVLRGFNWWDRRNNN
jgi:hypothetical protein